MMAAWLKPVSLAGSHVRLEPMSTDHVPALCEVGLHPALWRWTTTRITSSTDMEVYVTTALREHDQGLALPFVTIDVASNRIIGSTRFANADAPNRRVEIGWTWVTPSHQRTPANSEAKYLMLRHAFETLGCNRVEFKTDALNAVSRRALGRIGAREEGTLRRHMVVADGRVRDSVYFSVIREEWPDVRARLEALLARPYTAEPVTGTTP